jgi:hypothetical protein
MIQKLAQRRQARQTVVRSMPPPRYWKTLVVFAATSVVLAVCCICRTTVAGIRIERRWSTKIGHVFDARLLSRSEGCPWRSYGIYSLASHVTPKAQISWLCRGMSAYRTLVKLWLGRAAVRIKFVE